MLVKIAGCAVIMLSAAKIGFDEAARYSTRVKELRELQSALIALKGEISFCRSPLSRALENTGMRLKTAVSEIFITSGENLKDGVKSVKEVWDEALFDARKRLSLKSEDIYILSSFGSLLGVSDAAGQLENIELTASKLKLCENQAAEDEKRLSKLYRSLGIIGGIFLSVLFL